MDFNEVQDHLDLKYWFESEGIDHKLSRGVSGMQINARECPMCGNIKWKTYLNEETGLGNCFSCNEVYKGKADFIHKKMEFNSWRDTIKYLEAQMKEQGWKPKVMTVVDVEKPTAKLPDSFELPTKTGENLVYLEKRGINAEISKYFNLRYCVEGWWNFKDEDGKDSGQNFAGRVIIPIYDIDGTFVTFQGRDITGESDRKYLFPKCLPGTGAYIYNAQNAILSKRVVMGEGVFDVAAIKMALDEEPSLRDVTAIGSFGKHLSYGSPDGNDQLGKLIKMKKNGLQEITIMWDGEQKALTAALAAAEKIKGIGLVCKIALLPQDKDPNEVSGDIVRDAYKNALTYTPSLAITLKVKNPYKNKGKDDAASFSL